MFVMFNIILIIIILCAGDEHYNCASALQKSIRGSNDNAAIYWLARMLEGGEDPLFIARRLVVTASEDIGSLFYNVIYNITVESHNVIGR